MKYITTFFISFKRDIKTFYAHESHGYIYFINAV